MAKYEIAAVVAEFNYDITQMMLELAHAEAKNRGCEITKVVAVPPKSPVKVLASFSTFKTAFSNLSAASFSPMYLSIMIAESIMAIGFAFPSPAISGAEP